MIRRLSTYFHIGGGEAFDEKTQDWERCPPEGHNLGQKSCAWRQP